MPSYKITIDDECAEHLEGQRAKVQAAIIQATAEDQSIATPWYSGYLEDVPSYILYLAIDHCRNIERNRVSEEKTAEVHSAIAAVDAHITTVTGTAEEIS